MKKLCAALLGLLLASAAQAQTTFTLPPPAGVSVIGVQVVTTCNSVNLTANSIAFLAMDHTGALCTNASGGGGGGGAVTLASGAVASGAYSSGSVASGAFASGSIASGAVSSGAYAAGSLAAGSLAAGAGVDGWDLTQGAKADAACGTATGTCSEIALIKYLNTAVSSAIPAGTAIIGKVGIDQTTPGTTNGVQTLSGSTTVVTGNSVVIGPTADGSAASTAPVLVAGTVDGTATGAVAIPKVTSGGIVSTDTAQVNGVTTLTGTGATGTGAQRVTVSTDQATNAGAALVNGGVGVVNGGSGYETVAASVTGQALGATGGTGDYLSHCVIYPTTTTPGVVTVFDNTNAAGTNAIAFPGGASSVSNLVPIAIPVGAVSTVGAWKVTTGANVVVTCYGKFT